MTSIKSLLLSNHHKAYYSVELTPKDTFVTVDLNQLPLAPLFVSTTWISDDNLRYESLDKSPSLRMTKNLMGMGIPVLTHVSCYKLKGSDLDELLKTAVNLFPLRGDLVPDETQEYQSTLDLIREIRSKKGDDVTIFTSAYPRVYNSEEEEQQEMNILKTKIGAGCDAIITQVVYDCDIFTKFVKICRKHDIKIPIICGIYAPASFSALTRMEELTKQKIPETLKAEYKMFEKNEQLFKEFSIETTAKLINDVLSKNKKNDVSGVHFFTMNNFEQVSGVLKQIGWKN